MYKINKTNKRTIGNKIVNTSTDCNDSDEICISIIHIEIIANIMNKTTRFSFS